MPLTQKEQVRAYRTRQVVQMMGPPPGSQPNAASIRIPPPSQGVDKRLWDGIA